MTNYTQFMHISIKKVDLDQLAFNRWWLSLRLQPELDAIPLRRHFTSYQRVQ